MEKSFCASLSGLSHAQIQGISEAGRLGGFSAYARRVLGAGGHLFVQRGFQPQGGDEAFVKPQPQQDGRHGREHEKAELVAVGNHFIGPEIGRAHV